MTESKTLGSDRKRFLSFYLLVCTFVKCLIKLQEIKWISKIYLFRHLPKGIYEFSSEFSMKRSKKLKTTGGGGVQYRVTLIFFATLNKEQKSSYLQLCRRPNGKMLTLGFLYSKSTTIVQQKNAKKSTCQTIAFFAKYYKCKYIKNCPLKIACSRP